MQVFDRSADGYDSWYESKTGAFVDQVETELAFRLFQARIGMRVLDAGCGTGNHSIKLARMSLQVTGIDISENMLRIAGRKAKSEGLAIDFCKMDVCRLEYEDGTFDGVISMAAFEFIHEPEKALAEMFRVVKKGGRVLVGTINRDSSWGELYMSREFRENTVFRYASLKTMEELKNWNPEKLEATGQCLFVPPGAGEDEIGPDLEKALSTGEKGGFICASWIK